jgi:hypothetical protein
VQNWSAELRKDKFKFDFMLLAKGEKPTNPEQHILIKIIRESVIGRLYGVTGKGLDPAYQPFNNFTDGTLNEARKRATELAEAGNVSTIAFLPSRPLSLCRSPPQRIRCIERALGRRTQWPIFRAALSGPWSGSGPDCRRGRARSQETVCTEKSVEVGACHRQALPYWDADGPG